MITQHLRKATLTALVSGTILAFSHITAHAVSCGDMLGPGGSYVLDHDLLNCNTNPALTIVGPVKVDLGGHTISCANDSFEGVSILGEKAKVSNGVITSCEDGVTLAGRGQHQVSHLSAQNNQLDGFIVSSDLNRLMRNTANGNAKGFEVSGSNNTLSRNTASTNGNGIDVSNGFKNKVIHNIVTTNNDGIVVWLSATQTTVAKSQALNNSDVSINVHTNAAHKILGNTALLNGYLDLLDGSSCGSNVWKKNIYVTKDPACIQ